MGARDYLGGGGAASSVDQERRVIARDQRQCTLTAVRDIRPRGTLGSSGKELRHERPQ
jgi:hypothetical protein